MTSFPIFQERLQARQFRKDELPLFITHYRVRASYPNHHHEFAELSLVTEGGGTEIVNGTEHELRPGSVCLLLPYRLHALRLNPDKPLVKYCCMFDIGLLSQPEFSEIGHWLVRLSDDAKPFYELSEQPFAAMQASLSALLAEYGGEAPGKQGWMRLKLLETIYLFFRHHPGVKTDAGPGRADRSAEWDFVRYVNTHYLEDDLTLEKVAAHFGVSVFAVRGAFRRLLGRNFLDYVHLLRVRRAMSLLAATDLTVSEVAYEAGFASLRSFTRVFKEIAGVSATDYRKRHAGSGE